MFKLEYLILVTALVFFATATPFSSTTGDGLKQMKRGLNTQVQKKGTGDYGTHPKGNGYPYGEKHPENHGDDTSLDLPPHGIPRKKHGEKHHSPLHKSSPGHGNDKYDGPGKDGDESYHKKNHKKEPTPGGSGYSVPHKRSISKDTGSGATGYSTSQADQSYGSSTSDDKKVSPPQTETFDQEGPLPTKKKESGSDQQGPLPTPPEKKESGFDQEGPLPKTPEKKESGADQEGFLPTTPHNKESGFEGPLPKTPEKKESGFDQEGPLPTPPEKKESGFEALSPIPPHKKHKKPSHKKEPSYPVTGGAIPPINKQPVYPDISNFPPYRQDLNFKAPGPLPPLQKGPGFEVPSSSSPPKKIIGYKSPSVYPPQKTETDHKIQTSPTKEGTKYGSSQNDSSTSAVDKKYGSSQNDGSTGY